MAMFPIVPPGDATVLDSVVAIKHKLDEMNRLLERKVRLCANGSQQVAGLNFDKSYAPAILASSLCMLCSVACWLRVTLWHVDVSNAFQSTPDSQTSYHVYAVFSGISPVARASASCKSMYKAVLMRV